jgi:putative Mn2+ efflux pump MntP
MLTPILDFVLALSISINFFTFAQSTEFKLKGRALAPVITFMLMQIILFVIGWGLAQLLAGLVEGNEQTLYTALLAVIGLKRLLRYFTTKKEARSFVVREMFSLAGLSLAVAIDSLIFGLGFGLAMSGAGYMVLLLILATLFTSLAGILLKQRNSKSYGAIAELISGFLILAVAIMSF